MCARTRKTLLQGNQPLHRSSLAARRRPELPLAVQRRSDSESPSSSSLRNARREAVIRRAPTPRKLSEPPDARPRPPTARRRLGPSLSAESSAAQTRLARSRSYRNAREGLRNARREATLTPPFHTAYHHGSRRPPRRRRHDAAPAAARAAAPGAAAGPAPRGFHSSGAAVRRHAFGARSLRRLGSCLHTRGGSFAPIVAGRSRQSSREELPRRTRPSAWHVTTPCADGLGLGYLQPGKTIVYYRSDGGCQLSRPSPSDASRAVARAASILIPFDQANSGSRQMW